MLEAGEPATYEEWKAWIKHPRVDKSARDLTPRELGVLVARYRQRWTVRHCSLYYGVAEWRIMQVTRKAKAKIVDKIVTHLVTQK
jgi:DNA-directed RNA polymerase specialized sigma subunit